jgi:hypothetical protein
MASAQFAEDIMGRLRGHAAQRAQWLGRPTVLDASPAWASKPHVMGARVERLRMRDAPARAQLPAAGAVAVPERRLLDTAEIVQIARGESMRNTMLSVRYN